ncbi:MAG: response regulator [Oscillatoriaceae bacterium SKW80]|nr:response regulator [Oscillatoriaceae bacterium SKYG93]MCX8120015.1 response regulator [Oscillatoriaceae bacterium SKW80]MDW8454012.1 response regulator [Oscillatoriaceae cyanobacterium SKYGB_i_bin93]HIK29673.1 response regulator [Oscillatoriaceae cyanobacterium M7585_C2015_266]
MANILVVDDDLTVQLVLQDLLESEGYEVTVAADGSEALELAQRLHPDVIICDWMMPVVDGIELCRRIKASPELAATFFILLTAREHLSDRIKGFNAGADEFLYKPIETEELLARVRAGLRSHSLALQLSKTLQELQQTQAQLVQKEKMSSLGHIVAGIAHEINNPITFIYGNLAYVKSYSTELIELLRLYEEFIPNPPPALRDKIASFDKDFLIQDLQKVIDSMQNGAERIRKIVLLLQDFARSARTGLQLVDIHQCLDNTLGILQHRLHFPVEKTASKEPETASIEVIKKYGNLPEVECYAGELNQAFLNILNNAIDVLRQKDEPERHIIIQTEMADTTSVRIRIADNGAGMSEAVKSHIFDPFFTTKPVGSGTGLGLAISYQIIVSQHGGTLQCFSEPGAGTEFCIQLPTRQIRQN